jgi:DNA modification methylase
MIHEKDCLEFLKSFDDKSVDLVFYDPPYNAKKDYGIYKDNLPMPEYTSWMQQIARQSERVARRGVVVYVGSKLTELFFCIFPGSHLTVVHKRAAGVFSGNYMLQYHSMFSTGKPTKKCKDLWDDVRLPGEGYFFREPRYDHPGLTSLALVEKILEHFTFEGDLVVDPFAGVGTTWVACKRKNRNFIGSELNPKYIEVAHQRIANEEVVVQ